VVRLHDTNVILTEQVMEAERDRDAAAADSSAAVVRAGQYRYQHAALLEACGGVIDMLSPVGVSMEELLGNVQRRFTKVIRHEVRRGAALALVAATLWSGEDLHDMVIGFPPVEEPTDVGALAVEFRGTAGAVAESERVEDVIRYAPHDV
jgi:hypothetical protein